MIKVNNTYINQKYIDYLEDNEKDRTVFVHLVSGTSFLFCIDDWRAAITPPTINGNDF